MASAKKKGSKAKAPLIPILPANAAKLRQSAYMDMKAIDKMLWVILGVGLSMFLVTAGETGIAESDALFSHHCIAFRRRVTGLRDDLVSYVWIANVSHASARRSP